MTKFEGCYLTNLGLKMVQSKGLSSITFTRAVTGAGIYDSKEDIPLMTELKEQKQEFELKDYSVGENFSVEVKFKIKNTGLEEEYNLSEIGLYAKGNDEVEILYCVAYALQENTETIPVDDEEIKYVTTVSLETIVSADANVNIVYSDDQEWTKQYVEKIVGNINVEKDGTVKQQIDNLNDRFAGTWVAFYDEDGNPTNEPHIHWIEVITEEGEHVPAIFVVMEDIENLKNNKVDKEDVPFKLGIDENGNCGFIKPGEDTVTPFGSGGGGTSRTVGTIENLQMAKITGLTSEVTVEPVTE